MKEIFAFGKGVLAGVAGTLAIIGGVILAGKIKDACTCDEQPLEPEPTTETPAPEEKLVPAR